MQMRELYAKALWARFADPQAILSFILAMLAEVGNFLFDPA